MPRRLLLDQLRSLKLSATGCNLIFMAAGIRSNRIREAASQPPPVRPDAITRWLACASIADR
jgi:hypothetical protein